ncbi:hypothetical protein GRAN_1715 [Granulicella sibirica]|uniref:Uncharacterized protein n=1 Tax=Granulicella sibirica TaxID=2479048 RepID=A0A4Q0T3V7_9BACT|nr:hypothetical protein GRAN_1715 [Granulicella sibirica]
MAWLVPAAPALSLMKPARLENVVCAVLVAVICQLPVM